MEWHGYFFEAQGIQRYILDGSRLSDMVGASALVDALSGPPLDAVLDVLGLTGVAQQGFARRAAGSVTLFLPTADDARNVRDLFGLVVPSITPGLEFAHAAVSAATPVKAATKAFLALRASPSCIDLPEPAHLVQRSPRTGIGAVGFDGPTREWVDAATKRKREYARKDANDTVAARFADPGAVTSNGQTPLWPRHLDASDVAQDGGHALPFKGDRHTVGVVHADGNEIGKLIDSVARRLEAHPECYVDWMRRLSAALAQSTLRAAQRAMKEVLWPQQEDRVVPARPIVLGGDDLTIIVRGDLAVPFTGCFLALFEEESRAALDGLRKEIEDLPECLTACAGVTLVNAKYPFHAAYALSESMCNAAKNAAEDFMPASAVIFGRVTAGTPIDYRAGFLPALAAGGHQFTLGAYQAGGAGGGLPALSSLFSLKGAIEKLAGARGALRSFLQTVYRSPAMARGDYRRWYANLEKVRPDRIQPFHDALVKLGSTDPKRWPGEDRTSISLSPLGDAFALLSMEDADDDD